MFHLSSHALQYVLALYTHIFRNLSNLFSFCSISKPAAVHSLVAKVTWNGLQFNSIAANLDYHWPHALEPVFTIQRTVSEPGTLLMSTDCFVANSPFYWSCVSTLIAPFVICFLECIAWFLFSALQTLRGKPRLSRTGLYSAMVTTTLILHSTVAAKAFQMLSCKPAGMTLDGLPKSVLAFDEVRISAVLHMSVVYLLIVFAIHFIPARVCPHTEHARCIYSENSTYNYTHAHPFACTCAYSHVAMH